MPRLGEMPQPDLLGLSAKDGFTLDFHLREPQQTGRSRSYVWFLLLPLVGDACGVLLMSMWIGAPVVWADEGLAA